MKFKFCKFILFVWMFFQNQNLQATTLASAARQIAILSNTFSPYRAALVKDSFPDLVEILKILLLKAHFLETTLELYNYDKPRPPDVVMSVGMKNFHNIFATIPSKITQNHTFFFKELKRMIRKYKTLKSRCGLSDESCMSKRALFYVISESISEILQEIFYIVRLEKGIDFMDKSYEESPYTIYDSKALGKQLLKISSRARKAANTSKVIFDFMESDTVFFLEAILGSEQLKELEVSIENLKHLYDLLPYLDI
jgi:hypothetical protein